jgi:hypothetical protein
MLMQGARRDRLGQGDPLVSSGAALRSVGHLMRKSAHPIDSKGIWNSIGNSNHVTKVT